jgi:hypothetical protein
MAKPPNRSLPPRTVTASVKQQHRVFLTGVQKLAPQFMVSRFIQHCLGLLADDLLAHPHDLQRAANLWCDLRNGDGVHLDHRIGEATKLLFRDAD